MGKQSIAPVASSSHAANGVSHAANIALDQAKTEIMWRVNGVTELKRVWASRRTEASAAFDAKEFLAACTQCQRPAVVVLHLKSNIDHCIYGGRQSWLAENQNFTADCGVVL